MKSGSINLPILFSFFNVVCAVSKSFAVPCEFENQLVTFYQKKKNPVGIFIGVVLKRQFILGRIDILAIPSLPIPEHSALSVYLAAVGRHGSLLFVRVQSRGADLLRSGLSLRSEHRQGIESLCLSRAKRGFVYTHAGRVTLSSGAEVGRAYCPLWKIWGPRARASTSAVQPTACAQPRGAGCR